MSTLPLAIGYFFPRQSRGLSLVANNESPETLVVSGLFGYGARYRTRTCDPMPVKHVLYQLS